MFARPHSISLVIVASLFLGASSASAHFTLDAPPSYWSQGPFGDPQKAPPCGNDGTGQATNAITTVRGGDTVKITVNELIFHPGHYRVALGLTGQADLPAEPLVTPGDTVCGSTPIQSPAVFPVLVDGALVHTQALGGPKSFDVTIPSNVTCTKCVLQVLEFMSAHALNDPGGCFYNHCAVINVVGPDAGIPDGGDGASIAPPGCGCATSGSSFGGWLVGCAVFAFSRVNRRRTRR